MSSLEKILPNVFNKEQKLFGALLSNIAYYKIIQRLISLEHFYHKGHETLFMAIMRYSFSHEDCDHAVDTLELIEWIRNNYAFIDFKELQETIYQCKIKFSYSDNLEKLCADIREKHTLRQLIKAGEAIMHKCQQAIEFNINDVLSFAEDTVKAIKTHKENYERKQ